VYEEVLIRKSEVVDLGRVAAISNCTEYTLEMRGEARAARAGRSGDVKIAWEKCGRLVTIRKSEVVDLLGVAVISNRTRCRLEMRVRRLAAK
jgi:hypothetical protein